MEPLPKIKIWQPFLALVGVFLLAVWLINAFNTGNVFWFLPIQPTYQPTRIVVHDYGQTVNLQPGVPGFLELSEALNQTFSEGFSNTSLISIGLSDETLRRYNEEELVLEIYYPQDVRFNTAVRMNGVRALLIPIDGTHAGNNYLFLGSNGIWRAGAMVLKTVEPVENTLRELGYLAN